MNLHNWMSSPEEEIKYLRSDIYKTNTGIPLEIEIEIFFVSAIVIASLVISGALS
jgi:hypothetical protein